MKEEQVQKLNELRSFALAAPYLMPLLERRKQQILGRIISAYRTKGDLQGVAAELAVITDLENELKQKHNELNRMQEEK